MVLVVVAGAIFSHGVSMTGPAAGLGPWLVGSLVWGIGLSLGGTTGYAINPARDLGPRLVHSLLPIPGKGGSNWRYAWIPIVGDLDRRRAGGSAAALRASCKAQCIANTSRCCLATDIADVQPSCILSVDCTFPRSSGKETSWLRPFCNSTRATTFLLR